MSEAGLCYSLTKPVTNEKHFKGSTTNPVARDKLLDAAGSDIDVPTDNSKIYPNIYILLYRIVIGQYIMKYQLISSTSM